MARPSEALWTSIRFSLRVKRDLFQKNRFPPAGQEGRWIKTVPGRGWFAYIRIYGPEQAAFDRGWKPGDFQQIK